MAILLVSEQGEHLRRAAGAAERPPQRLRRKKTCEHREDFDVFVGALPGYQETEDQVYPHPVGGIEVDSLTCSYERAARFAKSGHPSVRKRNAMTESGAAEAFARAELVEDQALRQGLPRRGEKLTQHFESPLPAAQVRAHNHASRHEQIGDAYRHEESAVLALEQLLNDYPLPGPLRRTIRDVPLRRGGGH